MSVRASQHGSRGTHVQGTFTDSVDIEDLKRFTIVKEYGVDSDSGLSDSGDERPQKEDKGFNAQFEYWIVVKAMKFLKIGDQGGCAGTLALILTYDLRSPAVMHAICDQDGLCVLTNLIEANHFDCRLYSLKILAEMTVNKKIAQKLVDLGICPVVVKRLLDIEPDVQMTAARVITNVARVRKASPDLRVHGAVEMLITLLRASPAVLMTDVDKLNPTEKENLQVTIEAANALWGMSHFSANKARMMTTGVVKFISTMLLSGNKSVAIPMLGVLCSCSTEPMFQVAVETEGLVGILIKDLRTEDLEMQKLCAVALSRAAGGNDIVREMIRFHEGPKVIMELIMDTDASDYRMLTAGISAMWKSAISLANAEEFERLGAVPILVDLLGETEMEVLIATVGAVGEIAKCDKAREDFIRKGALTEIISLLGHINEQLLINSAHAVGICSDCDEGIAMLDKSDGLRLLWSLLKNKSERVKIEALWAVRPCVTRHPDSGELIRSLMDSLNLLVKMLKQENREVLTAVCAVVSQVALDLENLGVMTEQGVVKHLSSLLLREPRDVEIEEAERQEMRSTAGIRFQKLSIRTMLHRELASAVANCSRLDENRRAFGRAGVIPIIVDYMRTKNPELLAQTCRALHALSEDHFNCVSIQSCGAVPFLLVAIESQCMVTQIGAAGTLKNIRLMLHRSEEKRITFDCLPRLERQKKLKEIQAIVDILSGPREPDEDKELILKGHARASFSASKIKRAMAKRKSHGDSLTSVSFMKMQDNINKRRSTVLSWRERKSLLSLMKHETRDRHPSDQSAILHAQVATEKVRKISVDSQTSHGKEK